MTHRTIVFGTPEIAAQLLARAITEPELEVVLVVTEAAKPAGRGRALTPSPVQRLAEQHHLPVVTPRSKAELIDQLSRVSADLGLLLAYGRIIPPQVLNHFAHGIVNLHPSLLPKFRGPAPVYWAIESGASATGVSIMLLDEGMDSGPLLGQQDVLIEPADTTARLTDRLIEAGLGLLFKLLPDYLNGKLSPVPQHGSPTVTHKITKTDGQIDWHADVATIERQIRACQPWPIAWTSWGKETLQIHAAHLEGDKIVPDLVQLAGRKAVPWADFCRGQRALTLFAQPDMVNKTQFN